MTRRQLQGYLHLALAGGLALFLFPGGGAGNRRSGDGAGARHRQAPELGSEMLQRAGSDERCEKRA